MLSNKNIILVFFSRSIITLENSFLPFLIGSNLFFLVINSVAFFFLKKVRYIAPLVSFICLLIISLLWWKDISRERLLGYYTHKLELSVRLGILLFILSEIFFFFRFFWTFFDAAIAPTIEYGLNWPPKGIISIVPYSVPLLNTVILLRSGVSITWCHHAILINDYKNASYSLFFTIILGIYFLYIQILEYSTSRFSIRDGIYGSIFYLATGFHGSHVIVGIFFLYPMLIIY